MNNKQTLKCNDGLDDVYASIELASSLPKQNSQLKNMTLVIFLTQCVMN